MHLKLEAYLKGLRPLDSLGYVVVALIGAGSFFVMRGIPAAELLVKTFLIAEVLMGSIFLLNNRFDYAVDRAVSSKRASRNPVSLGLIGLREAEVLSLFLMILGLIAVTLWIRSITSGVLYVVVWSVGLMYSAPPLRFKSRAGFDVLSHDVVVIVLFLMGYSFVNALTLIALVSGIPFLMLSTIYELRNHISDWGVDSSAGLRTTVAAFGLETGGRLLWISIFLFWVSLLAVAYLLLNLLGSGMMLLAAGTMASYLIFLGAFRSRSELIFDLHLWLMGGVYSAFKLLVLAGLL